MSEETNTQSELPVATAEESAPPARISLQQFCTELSASDRRVEMIGAFHHSEKRAARMYDTSDAYASRYDAFTKASPK
jgi:hypothetical protein